jgi:hypothetical protein
VEPTADSALSKSPGTSTSIGRNSTFNACAGHRGRKARENLQSLGSQFCKEKGLSRYLAAGMSHTGCEASGHQIGADDHHSRNLCRRAVSSKNPGKCNCHENVDIEGDEFSRQPPASRYST